MNEEIKLYDIREGNYPNKRGDSFRSLQVFRCWVCNALTNEIIMGGYPGYGVRAVCPNSSEGWHHDLEDKCKLRNPLHPKSYREELEGEINSMRKEAESHIKSDIVGTPDLSLEQSVTNVRSIRRTAEDEAFHRRIEEAGKLWASKPENQDLIRRLKESKPPR